MNTFSRVASWFSLFVALALVPDVFAQTASANNADDEDKAPDWLIWREFHQSLLFYGAESPDAVSELLRSRVALTDAQKASFMALGDRYLRTLVDIDSAARTKVLAQYESRLPSPPPYATKPTALLREDAGAASRGLLPGTMADGRPLREVLEADGVIEAVENQKQAALEGHLSALSQAFGEEKLSRLRGWIAVDVTPKVSVVSEFVAPNVPAGAFSDR